MSAGTRGTSCGLRTNIKSFRNEIVRRLHAGETGADDSVEAILSGLNGEIQRWVCSKNPGNFDEAFAEARREEENVLMSRRQGKNLEGGDNEKIPKHIEEAIARLEV